MLTSATTTERIATTTLRDHSQLSIREYITHKAREYGVSVELALYVAAHESNFRHDTVGDLNIVCRNRRSPHYGKAVYARGVYQFTRCYYPHVSDADAFDPVKNIELALPLLANKSTCLSQFTTCRWYYYGKPN